MTKDIVTSTTNMINEIKVRPPRMSKVDEAIGENIRLLRLKKNMTLQVLADALSISFQQLSKYEKGSNQISASRLLAISKILGVDIGVLYEEQVISRNGTYLRLFEKVGK